MGLITALCRRLNRPVPAEVRDAHVLSQYEQLRSMAPLLYTAIILIVTAAVAGSAESPVWMRYGIPALVISVALVRMIVWLGRPARPPNIAAARRMLRRARIISIMTVLPCSLWCIYSWLLAAPEKAILFPLFMAMGTLSTAFCLSMMRSLALCHIVVGLGPVTAAMMLFGDQMTTAAGGSIAVTCGFLAALLLVQHDRTIELLLLQHRMRELAGTDPLTGAVNRRALADRFAAQIEDGAANPSLILIDLDGFKPVNDHHGHAAGDEVLREVKRRLVDAAGREAVVCRMGGDEFAVLVPDTGTRTPDAVATGLLAGLARPFDVDGRRIAVGASLGMAHWPHDGADLTALFVAADTALYRQKAGRSPAHRPAAIASA